MYVIYGGLGRLNRVENNEILRRLSAWRRMKMTTVSVCHHSALSLATGFATLARPRTESGLGKPKFPQPTHSIFVGMAPLSGSRDKCKPHIETTHQRSYNSSWFQALEILDESNSEYLVQWAGKDPSSGKE